MNLEKLMKLHANANKNYISRDKEHSQITADVAIKFWEWLRIEQEQSNIILTKSDNQLFEYFINHIYKAEE